MTTRPDAPGQCARCDGERDGRQLCPQCALKDGLAGSLPDEVAKPLDLTDLVPPPREPRLIGGHKLLEELGRGGMGVVYKAFDKNLNRPVALKVISGPLTPQDRERFRIEGEATAALKHDNIVTIHEAGEEKGQPYFTMELIEGGDLHGEISACQGRPLPLERAASLIRDVARAVHHAHGRGILHRDLKPRNILLNPLDPKRSDAPGKPYVTDFGLAKFLRREPTETNAATPPANAAPAAGLAGPSHGIGTCGYASPEQVDRDFGDVTTASDVFSLGAILYHLITGRAPFPTNDWAAFIPLARDGKAGRPSTINPQVDPDLDAICLRCLEPDPKRRVASAADVANQLERWLRDEPCEWRRVSRRERMVRWTRRNRAKAWLGSGMVAALAIGAVFSLIFSHRAARSYQQARYEEADALASKGRTAEAMHLLARLVHDHRDNRLAADRLLLLLSHRNLPIPLSLEIRGPDWLGRPSFTKDGTRLQALTTNGEIQSIAVQTGQIFRRMLRRSQPRPPMLATFSQDGRWLAVADEDHCLGLYDANSGQEINRTPTASPISTMEFSTSASGGTPVLMVCHRDGTLARRSLGSDWSAAKLDSHMLLPDGAEPSQPPAFSSDGRRLAVTTDEAITVWDLAATSSQPAWTHRAEPARVELADSGGRLVTLPYARREVCVWDSVSNQLLATIGFEKSVVRASLIAEGTQILTLLEDGTLRLWQADLGQALSEPFGLGTSLVRDFVCLPAGRGVVTMSSDGTGRLWRFRPPASAPFIAAAVNMAAFSRRGRWAVTASNRDTRHVAQVWTWDARQSPAGRPLSPPLVHPAEIIALDLSSDGRWLATAARDERVRIWEVGSTNLVVELPAHAKSTKCVAFRPNSRQLLTGGEDGVVCLWDATHAGTPSNVWPAEFRHTNAVAHASFSQDGQRVATASLDGTARIWDVRTGQALGKPLPHADRVNSVAFSPDGWLLLTACDDGTAQLWDMRQGSRLGAPLAHKGNPELTQAVFSPDGARIATVAFDQTAVVWDMATRRPLSDPMPCGQKLLGVSFDAQGQWLLCHGLSPPAVVWPVPGVDRAAPAWLGPLVEGIADGRADIVRELRIALLNSAEDDPLRSWAQQLLGGGPGD